VGSEVGPSEPLRRFAHREQPASEAVIEQSLHLVATDVGREIDHVRSAVLHRTPCTTVVSLSGMSAS
jgi:hypothetical protein